jgi:hypothetical protein
MTQQFSIRWENYMGHVDALRLGGGNTADVRAISYLSLLSPTAELLTACLAVD